ncbi:MAG TPA: hypothetical protein VFQ35_10765 [Polyangiaceae bacterium]|nr:hypothetical protein [Polyangiaceae bacterium]
MATWTPLLSTVGLGLVLTEAAHGALVVAAIAVSLTTAGLRARRLGTPTPLLFALAGAFLLALAHWHGASLTLSASAVVAFVLSAVVGRRASGIVPAVRREPV